jgi:hypothetical protein
MKIKDDLMLRHIADSWVVVPMGERLLEFNGMLKVNDTGAFIWRLLEQGKTREQIVSAMFDEYEIDLETASREADTFIKVLSEAHVLKE